MKKLLAAVSAFAVLAVGVASAQQKLSPSELDAEVARILSARPEYAKWLPEDKEVVLNGPKLPGVPWRTHDIRRPQPPKVDTGREPCGRRAPADAVVLFDGRNLDQWTGEHIADWSIRGGALQAGGKQFQLIQTKERFGDAQVHLEFKMPTDWQQTDQPQQRGNGGVYLMSRYELQVLNNYNSETYPDGTVGAVYGQTPPIVNASRPPGVWQCYDITFRAPRFNGQYLVEPARVTAYLNGVLVQNDTQIMGSTTWRELAQYEPHAAEEPFGLQDHGDKTGRVQYRNIWIRKLDLSNKPRP